MLLMKCRVGRPVSAAEALNIGLVHRVVPKGQSLKAAEGMRNDSKYALLRVYTFTWKFFLLICCLRAG
jgi:hypothetical protein